MKNYYEAYDERYKVVHQKNLRCMGYDSSPIVAEILKKHAVPKDAPLLELGCGEGRDSIAVLEQGYLLQATDVSPQAIAYCKEQYPDFEERFAVLDAVKGKLDEKFDFIYSVAVIHMLVDDESRASFYAFIRDHLTDDGIALICTMGDGTMERATDITKAFDLGERTFEGNTMLVAETSCRIVTFEAFEKELTHSHLEIVEKGLTSVENQFPVMMYAVVKREP